MNIENRTGFCRQRSSMGKTRIGNAAILQYMNSEIVQWIYFSNISGATNWSIWIDKCKVNLKYSTVLVFS